MQIRVEKIVYETIEAEIGHCFCCGQLYPEIKYTGISFQVYCRSCSARSCTADTPEQAIKLHNWVSENIDQTAAYLNFQASI